MRVVVSSIRFDGLIVLPADDVQRGREMWLPAAEWSRDLSDWESAKEALNLKQEIDVVPLNRFLQGRPMVSRKGISSRTLVDSGTTGMVRDMQISDVGRRLVRGSIGFDTPSVLTHKYLESYFEWLSEKNLSTDIEDHGVLTKGDFIRGFVKGIDDNIPPAPPSVIVDVVEYLDFRSAEIQKLVMAGESVATEDHEPFTREEGKISAKDVLAISPCLLVDDEECREPIANYLRHEGLEVHTLETAAKANEFLSSISEQTTPEIPFRLAILDPNLEQQGGDLIGLKIANELRAKSDCRVVIMTGEIKNTIKLEQWPNLGVHGYIEKPFTMDQLISEIKDAVGLPRPIPLSEWIETDLRNLTAPNISERREDQPAGDDTTISEALRPLLKLKAGSVVHVFELHPRSHRARSLGSCSGSVLRWEALRGKISKSVIKDTALATTAINHPNVDPDDSSHLWTMEMMKYQSFFGLPITVKGKLIALVAFHPDKNAFDFSFRSFALTVAERVGRVIERQILYQTRKNEAELASFGMVLAALAHELYSDMTALDANLKTLDDISANNFESPNAKADALLALSGIRGNVYDITRKTKVLRRTDARSEQISLGDCLRKAAKTCRTVIKETLKHSESILLKEVEIPEGDWNVSASEASLIIVFFNLYLNAAQQIELTSSVRKHGLISNSLTLFRDAKGKAFARIHIHDTGPGIHRDDWEQIFEPGHTTKPNGSGLGLYICRYLLKDCSGSIAVTSSAIWDGTTVTVTLPLID